MLTQLIPGDGPIYGGVMNFYKLIPENHSDLTTRLERWERTFPQITPTACLINTPEEVIVDLNPPLEPTFFAPLPGQKWIYHQASSALSSNLQKALRR